MIRKIVSFCVPGLLALAPSIHAAALQPNIVLILVDDLGWMDPPCHGRQDYETPNPEVNIAQGIRFTDAYAACPGCSPPEAAVQPAERLKIGELKGGITNDCGATVRVLQETNDPGGGLRTREGGREKGTRAGGAAAAGGRVGGV